jgi:signal transduction histidine kinase/ligand-binding sensor domain-containing protein/AraC-like DNA-binding protein
VLEKMVIMKKIFLVFLLIIPFTLCIRANNYQAFDNFNLDVSANSIKLFIQDSSGLMWIGTNMGLYNFDGYRAYPHYTIGDKTNCTINCGLQFGDNHLLLGTETGFLLFNTQTDQYETFLPQFKHDIRSLLKIGDELWIGCIDGLFIYNTVSAKLSELRTDPKKGIKHKMVYALLEYEGYIYLNAINKLCRYSIKTKKSEILNISGLDENDLIHSLLKDDKRKCIWIGQGGSLLKYSPNSGTVVNTGNFFVVKSMTLDGENNLIIGTDNGLYIYNEKGVKSIFHDAREPKSLANNVVCCVLKDQLDNIWLGTDNGISLSPKDRKLAIIPIYKITGTGEGNRFYNIFCDSLKNYWLGGTNGLILSQKNIDIFTARRWYKMGGSPNFIFHNHIRNIYEDKEKDLWVATDYGLNRYDYLTQKFIWYSIKAPNGTLNAHWAYDIIEDNYNRLWIASFNGGIFVIEKKKLLMHGGQYFADVHYSKDNGMSGNNIVFIIADKFENVWALVYNVGVDIINKKTGKISRFPIKKYTGGAVPSYLLDDKEGFIWAGYRNGVLRINPENKKVDQIAFNGINNAGALSMIEAENSIWVSTVEGIWIIDKRELTYQHLNTGNHIFTSMFYDISIGKVILGGIDEIALLKPDAKPEIEPERIMISEVYVNNLPYTKDIKDLSIRYTDKINLAHYQNNIKIEFSDLTYSQEKKATFVYRLNGDKKWTSLASGINSIQLNRLIPGTYNLLIGKISSNNTPPSFIKTFSIIITPPWYGTLFAKIIYFLLILLFAWWVYFFIKAKNRMKYERIEKEKSLEQSKLKIAFFSDVAHEFKTPLSLIIAPLSRLIPVIKNIDERNAIEMAHQNALKLNSLIHQAIDYYRDDSKVNIGLLLSRVELVEFARSIFFTYKEGMKGKQVEFIFNSNAEQIFLNIDTVKIDSVFNNLLSNACKFTNPGDSIIFSLKYNPKDNGVKIKVSDTGVGIPKQDIPYVFQRFFQSSENSKGREGTGIGLFLVKNYIELHGGKVDVTSETGKGTTFNVWLPILVSNVESQSFPKDQTSDNTDKQLILIVEDNAAIADFIYNTFAPEYRCIIAYNGKTGLKACIELKPDIIISDVMMPEMDGLEMARHLKDNIQTSTIPLILLTAKDDKETELESIELNIDAFIAKPFDSTILYSRVKQLLNKKNILEKKVRIEAVTSPKVEETESVDEKFLAKITRIIEDNIADPMLNVNMLSELVDMTPKPLYRKLKQLTGMTAVDYIKSIRMKKAAMYLSNKNFTIAEVMYMVGFSSPSYFAKCFQSTFGKTPRQYLEQEK